MRIFKLFIVSVVAIALASCEPTYKKEYSWAYPIAGDWLVTAYLTDGTQMSDPFEMRAYNSSFGKDSIWIDDYATTGSNGNWYSFKFKVAANMSAQTFEATTTTNALPNYHINVVVQNGKIIKNDSIYMEVVFGDDPTTTYVMTGHRETSYEDYMGQH
jgi:hypothetical protein